MADFLERVLPDWDAATAGNITETQRRIWRESIEENMPRVDHWHWRPVFEKTFLEIFNPRMRKTCFNMVKAIGSEGLELVFGSPEWKSALFNVISEEFPVGNVSVFPDGTLQSPFWVSLGSPPRNVYELYKDVDIPVFSDIANSRLNAKKQNEEQWTKMLTAYYSGYLKRIMDIYLIVNPNDETTPRYKIVRSLAIATDQRVFLVEDIVDHTRAVIKWESNTEDALFMWRKIRKTGVKIFDFQTKHVLTVDQPVLLMEQLMKIDASDDMYQLLLDVIDQLQSIHRAGIVHADLKLDNIMKRVRDRTEYFIIDYDSVSSRPMQGVENAVQREAYSPWWASQVRGEGAHPTSYRYDLEELYYAVGDLAKIKRRVMQGPNFQLDWYVDAETRWKNQFEMEDMIKVTHKDRIINELYLSELFPKIMNLPERLPFNQIDHTALLDYIKAGMQPPTTTPPQSTFCTICMNATQHPIDVTNSDKQLVQVCSLRCSLLADPGVNGEKALAYREATRCIRAPRGCVACGAAPQYRCPKCRLRYCSSNCFENHDDHQWACE